MICQNKNEKPTKREHFTSILYIQGQLHKIEKLVKECNLDIIHRSR